jgi:hypothetical protein
VVSRLFGLRGQSSFLSPEPSRLYADPLLLNRHTGSPFYRTIRPPGRLPASIPPRPPPGCRLPRRPNVSYVCLASV